IAVHPQPAPSAVDPWPGDAAEAPALIALFSRGDLLSARASEVLATRGAAAVRDLVAALTSDIAEVRQYAARTLGAIATGEPALDALVRRLSDEVWEVRWDAEEAIVRFGSAGIEAVLEELTHAAPDARFNQAVLHVLERAPMDMWETLKPVVQTLRSGDSALSAPIAAAKAIQTLRRAEPAAVG
ncbi:MAG TPA: HEAT repeat domain-containing protein, partial [Chloroflexota bacterium]|nr:HEAT repeat domain-containing protein [Chloroflexota bacterium]